VVVILAFTLTVTFMMVRVSGRNANGRIVKDPRAYRSFLIVSCLLQKENGASSADVAESVTLQQETTQPAVPGVGNLYPDGLINHARYRAQFQTGEAQYRI
jgi:hypothetical protein